MYHFHCCSITRVSQLETVTYLFTSLMGMLVKVRSMSVVNRGKPPVYMSNVTKLINVQERNNIRDIESKRGLLKCNYIKYACSEDSRMSQMIL